MQGMQPDPRVSYEHDQHWIRLLHFSFFFFPFSFALNTLVMLPETLLCCVLYCL